MKIHAHLFVLLLALSSVSGAFAGDDSKPIQGSWHATSAEMAGQPLAPDSVKGITLKMDAGHYETVVAGQPDKGTYRLLAASKPKRIDVILGLGPDAGHVIPAIYDLSGDTLRICYSLRGTNAPAEFKTAAGATQYLVVYQRDAKK